MRRSPFSSYDSSKFAFRRLSIVLSICALLAIISLSTVFATGVSAGSITQFVTELFSPTLPERTPDVLAVSARTGMTARSGHTATIMRDGRVLIVGGDEVGSAQIFEPVSGEFAATGFLRAGRRAHTATLLGDGRVLIAGGIDRAGNSLSSTEIFADGAFSAGPDLKKARAGHTITVLNDWQLVILGGNAGRDVEVIDAAATQSRVAKGSLPSDRSFHSARLLRDGRILVVGGRASDGEAVLTAERIDPKKMTVEEIGGLHAPRIRPVLNELPDGKVQVIGGNNEGTLEIYSPDTGHFSGHAHVIPNRDPRTSRAFKIDNENSARSIEGGSNAESVVMRSASRAALINHGEAQDSLLHRADHAYVEIPSRRETLVFGGKNSSGEPLATTMSLTTTEATITTDAVDYPPDFPVVISGTGWEPGETVQLTIVADRVPIGEGEPVTTVLSAVADENGDVLNEEFMTTQEDLGAAFVLTAVGLTSGRTAQTTFTDASPGNLGNYATTSLPNTPVPTLIVPSNVAPNVVFSDLTRGTGLTGVGTANAFNSSNWTSSASPDANDFYEFTITPNAGFNFSAAQMRVGLERSGTGPASAVVRSSLDGYVANIGSVIAVPSSLTTLTLSTINLSGVSGLQNSTSPVTVRIYGYASTATSGTLRVQRITGGSPMVGVELDGTVAAACTAPSISVNPTSLTKNVGEAAVFSVTASGTAPLGYQWRKGGVNIPGAMSSSYTIPSVVAGDAGSYDVVVTNSCGTATSTAATLTVNVTTSLALAAPTPASVTFGVPTPVTLTATLAPALAGQSISFTVTAPGGGTTVNSVSTNGSGVATFVYNSAIAVGTYSVTATFAGATISSVAYSGSTSNTQTFEVVKANQTIAFGALAAKTYGDAAFTVSATGGASGNPVTFAATGNCTATGLNGSTITITGAGSCTVTASQAGNTNYNAATDVPQSFTISAKTVTPNFTVANKVYDGTTAAPILSMTLTGVVGADDVILTGGIATFDNKNVGTGKTVTATGFTLSGAAAGNYVLSSTSATTTADITPRTLNITATGVNKVYDGTAAAAVTLTDDRVSGDVLTIGYATADFADKSVGNAKAITVGGITVTGTDAGNYTFTPTANATANITPRNLNVTAAGVNRIYDATTSATVNLSDDRVAGDVFTSSYTSAAFVDKNVGTGKIVNVTGITIAGTDAGNYNLASTSAATTADITARSLVISAAAANKIYDGTMAASVTLSDNRLAGDVFTASFASATFADKHVGLAKIVTVSGISIAGTDAANYTANTSATATADITALHVTGAFTAASRVYDGTTVATVLTRSLTGAIGGDDVSLSGGTAAFADKHVGTAKTVTLTGATLAGADSGNYVLDSVATTTADITARSLTVSASGVNRVYDGNTNATASLSTDKVSGDDVTTSYTSASFANKNVGTGKAVSVSGISISGADAGNYALSNTTASTTADITPRTLTISATGINKVYDGNTTATVTLSDDRVAGDLLTTTYTSATFADKNVGTGKAVSVTGISFTGADAGNYVAGNTTAATIADITARVLIVTATTTNKVYDGNTLASATLSDNRVLGDIFTVSYMSATFDTKTVGTGKTVTVNGISITGADAGNYNANTSTTTTADITPLAITGSITANNKVYDGTAATTIATRTLAGVISGDIVNYVGGTATFADKNVGNGKTVSATGLGLSGTDAGNYTVNSTAVTTANITVRTLNVSATGVNKIYDGNATATVNLADDRVAGDLLTTGYTSASFANKNVGTSKPVSVSGISITGGADALNYVLGNATAATTADITARTLTVSATGVNKVYDGNTTATVTLTDDRVAGDVFTATYTSASFANKNVGTGKTVSVSGISISGTDAGNYTFNVTASTTADITALHITGSFTAQSKVYDGNTSATVLTRSTAGDVGGVTLAGGTATFADKNVGTGKTVTLAGATLTGTDAGNYILDSVATTTADIMALHITGSFTAQSKVYDGNTSATVLTRSTVGDVGGVTLIGGAANFADKNVGVAKVVTLTGAGLSGTDAANYVLDSVSTTTADITARALTISAAGMNKVYDGNTIATVSLSDDTVSGDVVTTTYASASFDNKNVGTGKAVSVIGISISGADAGNYTFNTTAMTTADITAKPLTVTAAGVNKVYDATTAATVVLSDDRVALDVFVTSYASASFDNKNVGTGKAVGVSGISIAGVDAANYTFNTTAATTADITALAITGSITASNKVYDGNTTAVIATRTVAGVISGDIVNYVGGTANFNNKNVGVGKPVNATGLSMSGTDAGNYTVNTTAATTADITRRTLTVTATAANKVYDGNSDAVVTLFDNRVAGDLVTVSFVNALFVSPNIGTGISVIVSGISIAGTDAGNYTLFSSTANTTANITAANTTTSVVVNPTSVQYSDTVTFTATVVTSPTSLNNQLTGSVQFRINGTAFGTPVAATVTGAGGTASLTFNNQLAPAVYNVSAVFTSTNTNFGSSVSGNAPLTITREDARVTYTGLTFVNTSCATCSTATVQLSATVKDITAVIGDPAHDVNAGNISNATLTFVNVDTGTDISPALPIALVSGTDPKVGTAVFNWNVNIGSADSDNFTVGFKVNGYYTRYAATDDEVIVVSKPIGTNFITGGGHLVMTSPTSSAGQYAGAAGLKTNFGFNVKYNNSGRNLQGRINVIVRGAGGRVYQIKGNQMDTLTVNNGVPTARTAIYTGKCSLTDITNPLAPISLGGGHSFQMKMTDKGEPGSADTIGITVYANNTGALLYSSRWNGTTTIEQLLGGGNTVVR